MTITIPTSLSSTEIEHAQKLIKLIHETNGVAYDPASDVSIFLINVYASLAVGLHMNTSTVFSIMNCIFGGIDGYGGGGDPPTVARKIRDLSVAVEYLSDMFSEQTYQQKSITVKKHVGMHTNASAFWVKLVTGIDKSKHGGFQLEGIFGGIKSDGTLSFPKKPLPPNYHEYPIAIGHRYADRSSADKFTIAKMPKDPSACTIKQVIKYADGNGNWYTKDVMLDSNYAHGFDYSQVFYDEMQKGFPKVQIR